jgi:hypothetical protein
MEEIGPGLIKDVGLTISSHFSGSLNPTSCQTRCLPKHRPPSLPSQQEPSFDGYTIQFSINGGEGTWGTNFNKSVVRLLLTFTIENVEGPLAASKACT